MTDKITILLDENVKRFDKYISRISFCAVELPDDDIMYDLDKKISAMVGDKIRFGEVNKLHFSELSEAQRFAITEVIAKIDASAKIYTYYCFNSLVSESKVIYAKATINHLKHIHRAKSINFLLEYSDEYNTDSTLRNILDKNKEKFIACDGYLSIFVAKLDNISSQTGAYDRMYSLVRERIRLQRIQSDGTDELYLTSNNRI